MRGTEFLVYQSWEDLGHPRCSEIQLINELRKFSRDSVLWACSYINVFLRNWEKNDEDISAYFDLLKYFYSKKFAEKMWAAYYDREAKRLVFHRRQLLYLCKLAIAHCHVNGLKAGTPSNGFGVILLKANDLLHFNLLPSKPFDSYSPEDLSRFIAELQAVSEYSHHPGKESLVRAHKLFVDIPAKLRDHHEFIDIQTSLKNSLGLDYLDIFSLTLAFTSRYFSLKRKDVDRASSQLTIPSTYLNSTNFSRDRISSYLNLVSISPTDLQEEASKSTLANDLTILRRFPLMHYWYDVGTFHQKIGFLPIDIEFLLEKSYSAPFWVLYKKHGDRFSRFWGKVFESYVNDILTRATMTVGTHFIPNPPSPLNQNEELCDGVIIGSDSIVLIESKATLLKADVKYSGDPSAIESYLREGFVRDAKEKKPKGVTQLANAARILFGENPMEVNWADLSRVKKCYLLLVTLDPIGDAICFSTFLQTFVHSELDSANFPHVEILPVFCTDIETLERAIPSLRLHPLNTILDRWYQLNPLRSTPLSAIYMHDWIAEPDFSDKTEWSEISRNAIVRLGITDGPIFATAKIPTT
jgi:hypothetical protein